jgi:hypothetical protein
MRMLMCFRGFIVVGVLFFSGVMGYGGEYEVKGLSEEQYVEYGLDRDFFKKGTVVQDILIATSDKVSDYTHKEAAYLFDFLMKDLRKDVAQRIRDAKVLCILVAHDELTSDVPQFKTDMKGKELDFYNWRQRGFLTKVDERYVVFFAEEDVMEYEGGMQKESILIHEFGHVIHGPGFDDELKKKWTETYEASMAKGLWQDGYAAQRFRRVEGDEEVVLIDALVKAFPKESRDFLAKCLDGGDVLVNGKAADSGVKVTGKDEVLIVFGGKKDCYASKNRAEFFAEGVQCWYDTNRTMDHDHNHIHTRDQLKEYDVDLAVFCKEILGDAEWKFVSPRERAGQGHLAGYDAAKAPVVKMLPHIREASLDYYDEYWSGYWERLHEKHGVK